jgi:hypothetical protein
MTFPNDFWMHPKVAPLPIEAKWTFVEMNGYSRMQDLDGRIPGVMAERLWSPDVLAVLVGSHPDRPLVVREGEDYVIRDYAEHQQTTAERDELSRKRSAAGARGRAKQLSGNDGASVGQVPGQIWAETETETETNSSSTKKRERATRGSRLTPDWLPSADSVAKAKTDAPHVDHKAEHASFVDYWVAVPGARGLKLDWEATWRNWMRRKETDLVSKGGRVSPEERARRTLALASNLKELQ